MEAALAQQHAATDEHGLGDGIILKRNSSFTSPRVFTKPFSTQPPPLSFSTSSIPPIGKPAVGMGFNAAQEPLGTSSAPQGQQPVATCELLPYLIHNFQKFINVRKTLAKVLSIFCIATWRAEEVSLLWYVFVRFVFLSLFLFRFFFNYTTWFRFKPLVTQEIILGLFNSKYLEIKEKTMELLNQLLRGNFSNDLSSCNHLLIPSSFSVLAAKEIFMLAQLPEQEGKEMFSILDEIAVLLSSNKHGAKYKV